MDIAGAIREVMGAFRDVFGWSTGGRTQDENNLRARMDAAQKEHDAAIESGDAMRITALVIVSWTSCVKPKPSGPDGRTCFVAVLDAETAMLLRASRSWPVMAGDLIQTPECAMEDSRERVHHLYELTR